jgi:hypothetical protein
MNVQDRVSFQESWPGIGELAKLKDYYVVKGNWQDGRRFGIYDREGNLLRTEGSYPFKEGSMEPTQRYLVYQGHTISNPNGNYFTMGCAFSDNIEFYEVRSNETVLLKRYQSYDATIESNATSMRLLDNTILSWAGGFGTAKYCYMLFLGKPFGEIRPNGSGGYKIVIFDWEGNYIKTLESAIRIRSFSVDENDSQIHAVVRNNDGEIGIMQFNINI